MTTQEMIALITRIEAGEKTTVEEDRALRDVSMATLAEVRNENSATGKWIENRIKESRIDARRIRCGELLAMNRVEMFRAFIETPGYTFPKISIDKETGRWIADTGTATLSFYDLENAFVKLHAADKSATIAEAKNYDLLLRMFLDNLQLANAGAYDLAKIQLQEKTCSAKAKTEMGFDGIGKEKLKAQLRLVLAAMIPAELLPEVNKQDVGYLLAACDTAKDGRVKVFNEKQLMKELFVVVRTRTRGDSYPRISKARIYTEKKADPKTERA